ncbi:MAG: outer membrane beta-barrel protein [Azoarcus sp.]|jgi:opacity protein-like surface antigen|nr:outer membrane beta-barrel protein [Azoarcus sp.]
MKKFLIPLLLTPAVLLPPAPCAAEPVGVYVAPRFTAGTVKFNSAFTPYVSLGLGTSFVSVKGKSVTKSPYYSGTYSLSEKTTTHTAWNIGIGSAWRLSDTISLDLGYRYANLGNKGRSKADEDDASDYYRIKNIETHQFILGAKFLF